MESSSVPVDAFKLKAIAQRYEIWEIDMAGIAVCPVSQCCTAKPRLDIGDLEGISWWSDVKPSMPEIAVTNRDQSFIVSR